MRDPHSKNPHQCSLYIQPHLWAAAKEMAERKGPLPSGAKMTISAFIVSLIEREKRKVLGERWKP